MTDKARITQDLAGSGSFLDPPTYPTHEWGVETDLRRRPENRGSMSLEAAVDCEWIDSATRHEAKRILDSWEPPAIDSPAIQEWIAQVLGYFAGCYRGKDAGPYDRGEWAAESLTIDKDRDPVANADDHAGVHTIRKYYPDFTPTAADFKGAYWGKKDSTVVEP